MLSYWEKWRVAYQECFEAASTEADAEPDRKSESSTEALTVPYAD